MTFKIGDRVEAQWDFGKNSKYYKGTISKKPSNWVYVKYDFGNTDFVPFAWIVKGENKIGSRITTNYFDNQSYEGIIISQKNDYEFIEFDDGDRGFIQGKRIRLITPKTKNDQPISSKDRDENKNKYKKQETLTKIFTSSNNLFREYEEFIASPDYEELDETEREAVIQSRIGQGIFREDVIKTWKKCSVTELSDKSLLTASHIKPWRYCSNKERLDPENGLLLNPALNHLFDRGLITFDDTGKIQTSERLFTSDLKILNVRFDMALRKVPDRTRKYLEFHRKNVFK